MDIQISEDILKKTISCAKNFSCLSEQKDLCEMRSQIVRVVYFIKHAKDKRCIYALSFDNDYICNCPTRQEIYWRYRIQTGIQLSGDRARPLFQSCLFACPTFSIKIEVGEKLALCPYLLLCMAFLQILLGRGSSLGSVGNHSAKDQRVQVSRRDFLLYARGGDQGDTASFTLAYTCVHAITIQQ